MTRKLVRIATRGSMLALRQSGMMKAALEKIWPEIRFELQIIKTTGDKITGVPLAKVGGKGLFVKEIEDALLEGSADLAVHSMKDVPAFLPEGLMIAALPEREDPRDALIIREGKSIADLRDHALIGTSSLRRAAQMRSVRSDFEIRDLRGNLDTRLRKLDDGLFDAIILAVAGLSRMGWRDRATVLMDPAEFVPAVGQGALAIEARSEDLEIRRLLEPLDHFETGVALRAERSMLGELGGGCQVPIGGFAQVDPQIGHIPSSRHGDPGRRSHRPGNSVELSGLVASLDGRQLFRVTRSAPIEEAELLGRKVAAELLGLGAKKILDEIYRAESEGPGLGA